MQNHCIVAEFADLNSASVGLLALEKAGFTQNNVSLVRNSNSLNDSVAQGTMADDESVASKPVGENVEAMSGAAAAGGAMMAAPSVATLIGPLMIAGPLLGIGGGAIAGAALGGMKEWGVADDVVDQLHRDVDAGGVLVIVNDAEIRTEAAREILKTTAPVKLIKFAQTDD